ncbi:MAG: toxin-antitoxin system YwqK family antitoxin [Candidatus Kapaibacterium sp.]
MKLSKAIGCIVMIGAIACSEFGCTDSGQVNSSEVEVEKGDPKLNVEQGTLYLGNTPFNGRVVEHYDNGQRKYATSYRDGRAEGIAEGWYADGSKMEERFYKDGKKEGTHRGWWENGAERFEYHFTNDLSEGNLREWYADGTLFRSFNYVDGEEEGTQQMWNNDGSIKANYVVRSGRRYGTLGAKPCSGTEGEPEAESVAGEE